MSAIPTNAQIGEVSTVNRISALSPAVFSADAVLNVMT